MKTPFATQSKTSRTLTVGLCISALVNFIAVLYQLDRLGLIWQKKYTYIGHDHPRELPLKVRTVNAVYTDDTEHYPIDGVKAWAEWNAIRPPGMGFVFLGEGKLPFGVAMWHQLHCLSHIRTVIVHGDPPSWHTRHCFNYLRQAVLCNGDITLDPGGGAQIAPGGGTVAPQTHSSHTCKDWRQIYDHLAENYKQWTPEQRETQLGVVRDTIHATPEGLPAQ